MSDMAAMDEDCHMMASAPADAPCCCGDEGTSVQAASHDLSLGILPHQTYDVDFSFTLEVASSFDTLPSLTLGIVALRIAAPSESPPIYLLNASFLI